MKQHYVLSLAVVVAFLGLCTVLNAQEAKKAKVLHFTRSQGFEHAPAKLLDGGTTVSGQALKKYFADKNIEVVETQDGGVFDGDMNQYDAFVFYTSGNLLNPAGSKNDKAQPMSEAGLRKMFAAVQNGKGFVGIHAASDSHCNLKDENGVDLFTKFIGAIFIGHGPQQFATLTITQPTTIFMGNLNGSPSPTLCHSPFGFINDSGKQITTWDEWYSMNQFNKDLHVLLIQETAGMEGKDYARPPFPATWIRKEGNGRVAYTSFGHDNRYFQNTENVRRIADLIEWSVGRFNADTTPNIEQVTPGAFENPPK